jgi:SAM-dependent methyltransferase
MAVSRKETSMVEQSKWVDLTDANPDHSAWYIKRFEDMAAEGRDLGGEARFVDAMASRGSRILDAGCGPGRVATMLADLGHEVVGVDVDPVLIAAAEQASSAPTWVVSDLAELDLSAVGVEQGFDIIVSTGNVMPFLAPSTRLEVLRRLADHLGANGRVVIGFGAGRDYEFDEFFADAAAAGLVPTVRLGTWDLQPFDEDADFLVAVFRGQSD